MTEYESFDDYVKNTFNIEPRELTHISPEEQKKKTVAITVNELINIWNESIELGKKNAKLKSIAEFQTSSTMDRYFQLKRSKEQLTKAKDIIRDYKIVVEGDHTTVCSVPEENRCINVLKLNEQAEQFLRRYQNDRRRN